MKYNTEIIEDCLFQKNVKTFTFSKKNKAILLDFVRQILQNREKEKLSIPEIKDCLKNGKYLNLSAKFVFNESDDWKKILKEILEMLKDMGYGIYDEYIYEKNASKFTRLDSYSEILFLDNNRIQIEKAIKKGKNIVITISSELFREIQKYISKIISFSLNRETKRWSKKLFKQINKEELFPFLIEFEGAFEKIESFIESVNGKQITKTHIFSLKKLIEDCCKLDIENESFEKILTPYAIIENKLIGCRKEKEFSAYHIQCIPMEIIISIEEITNKSELTGIKIYPQPINKIEDLLVQHYGSEFKALSLQEKYQLIYEDKLWEYEQYHVKYKFDDGRDISKEIAQTFKLVKSTEEDSKGWRGAYFNHNDMIEVFEFVKSQSLGCMYFSSDRLNIPFKNWLKNKKRISS